MQTIKKKIDQINNIRASGYKSAKDLSSREKVVGIKIDTNSKEYQDKVYYYKTVKDFKPGDKINPKMVTGGMPDCVVVSIDDKNNLKYKSLKELDL